MKIYVSHVIILSGKFKCCIVVSKVFKSYYLGKNIVTNDNVTVQAVSTKDRENQRSGLANSPLITGIKRLLQFVHKGITFTLQPKHATYHCALVLGAHNTLLGNVVDAQ